MKPEIKEKLEEFLDALEEEYGQLEGIEVLLEHPIKEGARQEYASIKEFNIMYLHKTAIDLK